MSGGLTQVRSSPSSSPSSYPERNSAEKLGNFVGLPYFGANSYAAHSPSGPTSVGSSSQKSSPGRPRRNGETAVRRPRCRVSTRRSRSRACRHRRPASTRHGRTDGRLRPRRPGAPTRRSPGRTPSGSEGTAPRAAPRMRPGLPPGPVLPPATQRPARPGRTRPTGPHPADRPARRRRRSSSGTSRRSAPESLATPAVRSERRQPHCLHARLDHSCGSWCQAGMTTRTAAGRRRGSVRSRVLPHPDVDVASEGTPGGGQSNSSTYSSGGPSSARSRSSRVLPSRSSSRTVTVLEPARSSGAGQ